MEWRRRDVVNRLGPALTALTLLCAGPAAAAPFTVAVDLTEAPRKIFHATLSIPATPGPLTLLYPKWIPGEHGPTGQIGDLAGLRFTALGAPVTWARDSVDMYAFHLTVPEGASSIDASLDFLSPAEGSYSAGASATANLVTLNWNQVILYPEGQSADDISVYASLRLPHEWKFGTALPIASKSDGTIQFQAASLSTLVDSPVIAGSHYRVVRLAPDVSPTHEIDIVSDSDEALQMSPDLETKYSRLVREAGALFGARHYRDYHFLLTLSDAVAHFGLEHHESSDDRLNERAMLDDQRRMTSADLLPHEFVHSWNGKYRRPADLLSRDFHEPMKTDLLWVYEGLTQYLGWVLAGRSGLRGPADWRDALAYTAANQERRAGRAWRPLWDTAVAAQVLYESSSAWQAWRRGTDFYDESALIWLEADETIRQLTRGKKSLDDFCRLFHGGGNTGPVVVPYTYDDVVRTLNAIAPHDWRAFLDARLKTTTEHAPLGGIETAGWRLTYTDSASAYSKAQESVRKTMDLQHSLGMRVSSDDGNVIDVVPGMPAAVAGVGPGMRLVAVNGRAWSKDVVHDALKAARTSSTPLELLLRNGEFFTTVHVDYHEGDKYPHLERIAGRPDLLAQIIAPHASRR